MSRGVGLNSPQLTVPERWGYPFWEVVRDFAEQGLTRADTGRALGYRSRRFEVLLRENPEHDPFGPYHVVSAYIKDTGEGFRAALQRMADAHYTVAQAAEAIGYSKRETLRAEMRKRGIVIRFDRPSHVPALEKKHGKTLAEILAGMAAKGYSRTRAARETGFKSQAALNYQMKVRGIDVIFTWRRATKGPALEGPHPWRQEQKVAFDKWQSAMRA